MSKTKHFKTLFALTVAAILFITGLFVSPTERMSANAAEKDDWNLSAKMTTFVEDGLYDTVYYFSDCGDSMQYVFDLMLSTQITKIIPEIYPWDTFEAQIETRFAAGIKDIKDGYVIFEMRSYVSGWYDAIRDYPYTGTVKQITFLSVLETFFATLTSNSNNCKIMLIFGTDEDLLLGNTGFLNYVKVQVNTDVLYPIFYTIYDNYYVDESNNLYTQTVLLSPSFSNIDGTMNMDFAFTQMLIFYYRRFIDFYSTSGMSDAEVWDLINQTHNFWLWEEYRDLDPDEFAEIDNLLGIGLTAGNEYGFWEEYMRAIREDYAFEFPLYIYNSANISVASWVKAGGNYLFYSGSGASTLAHYIPLILTDFVLEDYQSLLQYDNWRGICWVTFKPILPGPNGWIKDPLPFWE